ncbi:hypothetical protein [Flavobacterium phragmitis]|uniref:Uncharacterized protein n=1 Tax=Flavobacterium phragmitis TaxID=739143 RepID=A0A1I1REQ0_9FLAO|nr:hypothetical protein [Flavobacterium phragmitis]SFD30043.1 hypothetical protein SAMN05216297_106295 [Flavobacterium phragmitis]
MKTSLKIVFFLLLVFSIGENTFAQSKKLSVDDKLLQDSLYNGNKKKAMNFSMKDFDKLFFEFFNKKNDPDVVLTKTEFYTYTVQIAAFSDRLIKLYPEQKEVAEKNKENWLSENYEDYLEYKASQKK